jgi:hypothetical protein
MANPAHFEGTPGMNGGRPKGSYNKEKPIKEMLRRLTSETGERPHAIRNICLKMIEQAEAGDEEARREFFNRIDGYPVRPIANEGDVPMFLNVKWLAQPPRQVESGAVELLEDQQVRGNGRADEPD